jgi:hypothetical protein
MLSRVLRGKVPDWWLPDRIVLLETMPLAATGKIDKQRLRAEYAAGYRGGPGELRDIDREYTMSRRTDHHVTIRKAAVLGAGVMMRL